MGSITGLKELSAALRDLGDPKLQVSALREGVKNAAEPVLAKARANIKRGSVAHELHTGVTVMPGFASRNIVLRTKSARRKDRVFGFIGPTGDAYYASQFLELGTSKQAAQPWLVPAFEASQDEAIKLIGEGIKRNLERLAKKRAKKST